MGKSRPIVLRNQRPRPSGRSGATVVAPIAPAPLPYTCHHLNCGNAFSTVEQLILHYRLHRQVCPYRCVACEFKSPVQENVLKHIRTVHLVLPDQGDPKVLLSIDTEQLLMEAQLVRCASVLPHEDVHSESEEHEDSQQYVCRFAACRSVWPSISSLYEHTKSHTGLRPYRCSVHQKGRLCGAEFTCKASVRAHIRTVHWALPAASKREQRAKGITDKRNAEEFIQFNEALIEKETQLIIQQMAVNLWDGNAQSESQAEEDEAEAEPDEDEAQAVGRPYPCPDGQCRKPFLKSKDLRVHLRTHWAMRPYACTLCAHTATTKGNLLTHLRVHLKKGEIPQGEADTDLSAFLRTDAEQLLTERKRFSGILKEIQARREEKKRGEAEGEDALEAEPEAVSLVSLSSPVDRAVSPILRDFEMEPQTPPLQNVSYSGSSRRKGRYLCGQCSSYFPCLEYLRQHRRQHTGHLPFSCRLCGNAYSSPSSTLRHLQGHFKGAKGKHSITGIPKDYLVIDSAMLEAELKAHPEYSAIPAETDEPEAETADEEEDETVSSFSGLQLDDSESDFSITDLAYSSPDDSGESSSDYSSDSSGDETPKQYVCPAEGCPCAYRRANELQVHRRSHRDLQPYRCTFEDCNAMFVDQRRALRHVRLVHFGLPPTQTQQRRMGIEDSRNGTEFVAFDVEQLETGEEELENDREATSKSEVCPVDQEINPFKCLWPGYLYSATQKSKVLQHICTRHLLNSGLANPKLSAQKFIREGPRHACTYASVTFRRQALCLWTGFSNSVARKRHEREHFYLAAFHCTGRRENGRPCGYKRNKWGKVFRHARECHLKIGREVSPGEATNEDASPRGSQFIKVVESLLDYDRL